MKRWFLRGLLLVGVLFLGLVTYLLVLHEDRPVARASAEADALARRIEEAVNIPAWRDLQAVRWVFGGHREVLWDKHRKRIRVVWGENEVLRAIDPQPDPGGAGPRTSVVRVKGALVHGAEAAALFDQAYAHWANDSFWLNPLDKLFDPGVTRALAKNEDGEAGLLVSYSSGGVTPGDAYLWHLGPDDVPIAWQMWVDLIPVGGLRASWEGWTTLGDGAKIATKHEIGFLVLELSDVVAGHLADVEPGPDPFAELDSR